jgi:hypothetical protein
MPHMTPDTITWKRWRIGALLSLAVLLLALAGCVAGGGSHGSTTSAIAAAPQPTSKVTYLDPGASYPLADVHFQTSIGYLAALQFVTNLGLQPLYACTGYDASNVRWQSQDESGGFTATAMPPRTLEVAPTSLAPGDWLQRLAASSSVASIYDGPQHCPLILVDLTPVPGRLYFLGQRAWLEYVRVTFAPSSANTYGQALSALSALGFRLADPCYEQSLPAPLWRSMSQQASFGSGGALVVAITEANSAQWSAQLKDVADVVNVTAPYAPSCPAP